MQPTTHSMTPVLVHQNQTTPVLNHYQTTHHTIGSSINSTGQQPQNCHGAITTNGFCYNGSMFGHPQYQQPNPVQHQGTQGVYVPISPHHNPQHPNADGTDSSRGNAATARTGIASRVVTHHQNENQNLSPASWYHQM